MTENDLAWVRRCLATKGGEFVGTTPARRLVGTPDYDGVRKLATDEIALAARGFPNMPRTHFAFYDDDAPNAFVTHDREHDRALVAVSRGYVQLAATFLPLVFLEPSMRELAGFDDATLKRLGIDEKDAAITTVSVVSAYLFHFVVIHEIGHLVNGHLAFLFPDGSLATLEESERGNISRQTLEMDADCFAAAMSLRILLSGIRAPSPTPILKVLFSNSSNVFFTWYAGVYLFFRFHVGPGDQLADLEERSHPPPAVRSLYLLVAMLGGAASWRGKPKYAPDFEALDAIAAVGPRCGDWTKALETSFSAVNEEEVNGDHLVRVASEEGEVYMQNLHDEWARLYPELKKVAINPNLVPPQVKSSP